MQTDGNHGVIPEPSKQVSELLVDRLAERVIRIESQLSNLRDAVLEMRRLQIEYETDSSKLLAIEDRIEAKAAAEAKVDKLLAELEE